jgi:hypothetical protein
MDGPLVQIAIEASDAPVPAHERRLGEKVVLGKAVVRNLGEQSGCEPRRRLGLPTVVVRLAPRRHLLADRPPQPLVSAEDQDLVRVVAVPLVEGADGAPVSSDTKVHK